MLLLCPDYVSIYGHKWKYVHTSVYILPSIIDVFFYCNWADYMGMSEVKIKKTVRGGT